MNNLLEKIYNPDVLSCLANLSNDEVFTPPEVANKMIDLLPKELFESDNTTFLDPCCKSGVFLREIMKRLLNAKFPNYEEKIALINEKKMNKEKLTNEEMQYEKALQEKIDWVCHKQLYGISITRLTSLLSRRSLYCSKNANSKYSISKFDTDYGHIMYVDMKHTFKNGKCIYCGASESEYGEEKRGEELESHAYQFIHDENIVKGFNMKFDVIIGNPPYQISDGAGGQGSSATPIYNIFIEQAMKLNPRFLSMIVPSRWFVGGKGLDDFRDKMLRDKRITKLVDYPNSSECFAGVGIKGGVSYFLWERDKEKECEITTIENNKKEVCTRYLLEEGCDVFIRYKVAVDVYKKVKPQTTKSFDTLVSSRKPFGLASDFKDFKKSGNVEDEEKECIIYGNKIIGVVKKSKILQNKDLIDKYKIYISFAYGAGEGFPHQIINKPFVGNKGTCCTETYLLIGPFNTKTETENALSYIKTKFFRFMVLMRKSTQNATRNVYSFVPMQDFSESWNDEKLYKKYKLTKEEIDYIESMIKPMSDEEEDA